MKTKYRNTRAEQAQQLVEEYRDAGEPWPASANTMAAWAIRTGRWQQRPGTEQKLCAAEIADGMRTEFGTDPQGRKVRTKHAFRVRRGETYETLWGDWRTMSRFQAQLATVQQRAQIAGECKQLRRDVDSFNDNNCPDNPIQLCFNFNEDVLESMQPTEYALGRAS